MKTDKHIVAIDLGTSKIALSVAKVNGNDVQIVYYKETPTPPAGIKYSSIFNPKLTSEKLKEAITDAEDELGINLERVLGEDVGQYDITLLNGYNENYKVLTTKSKFIILPKDLVVNIASISLNFGFLMNIFIINNLVFHFSS